MEVHSGCRVHPITVGPSLLWGWGCVISEVNADGAIHVSLGWDGGPWVLHQTQMVVVIFCLGFVFVVAVNRAIRACFSILVVVVMNRFSTWSAARDFEIIVISVITIIRQSNDVAERCLGLCSI